MDFPFKTRPFEHQLHAYKLSKDETLFALLMEQGTGKSKVVVDTTAYLWGLGRINGLVVIAPNGVHRNWILNEIPTHLHEQVKHRAAWYSSNANAKERKALDDLFAPGDYLRILTINVEAFVSVKAKELLKKFLRVFDCLMVVDESSRIKTIGAKRTKTIIELGKNAKYKRILTGTPVTNSPLDIYAQFKFLSDDILGTTSFYAFKARYAELLDADSKLVRSIVAKSGAKMAPQIIATNADGTARYKNLEELKSLIEPYSYRVLKTDCLDLPDKLYQRAYYELPAEHAKTYKLLAEKAKIEWAGETQKINKLQLIMRLQQVAHGYIPIPLEHGGGFERVYADPESNPRIRCLLEAVEEIDTPVLIWCRFKAEIADVVQALRKEYPTRRVVTYFGETSAEDRDEAVRGVQDGSVKFFVGQPKSGGIGLTLTRASHVVYYSNDFSLEERLQSEDRAHRIGQQRNVTYIDIEALGTNDRKVVDALRMKKEIANLITGDATAWL